MTASPHSPMVDVVASSLCGWRNGKSSVTPFKQLSAPEQIAYRDQAQAALAACHAEEMRALLLRLADAHLGDRVFDEEQAYEVWRDAVALLAKLDGQP
jgi:hypothetical protein